MADKERLRAKDWPWLADQLEAWPDKRVNEQRTMALGALHEMGADVIRRAVAIEAAARAVIAAMGSNTPDWLRDEMQALEDALEGTQTKTEGEKLTDALVAFADLGGTIDQLGGNCPVQAEGAIDEQRFYFRARGSSWQFHVAATEADLFKSDLFYLEREYAPEQSYAAGWMPEHEAVGFMCEAVRVYRADRDLRDAHGASASDQPLEEWIKAMADDNAGTLQSAACLWMLNKGGVTE
jgi:hypothetical protein